jgi:GntR family transcriptional repressor for pyruvate dehydrogenase complex
MDLLANPPVAGARPPQTRFRVLGRKEGVVTRVVQALEREILEGRLPVGTRLPPERVLSQRLGVSRTVLREAIGVLRANGLVETRQGIGSTVRGVTRQEILKPIALFLRTSGEVVSLEHLHQVRSILEVENAGLAAEQATALDIEDLRRIVAEMERAANKPQQFAAKDAEFHRRIAQTTHNPLLLLLLDSIRDLMAEIRALVAQEQGLYERVMPTHFRVLECVEARDPEGARAAMREHLRIALTIQRELVARRLRESYTADEPRGANTNGPPAP